MFQTRLLPDTTDLLALQRLAPERYPLLMESTASGTAQGRWDLLLMGNGESLALHADGVVRDHGGAVHAGYFLDVLDAHWQTLRLPREETGLPFRGGWALMLDYELAGQIETVLQLPARADGLPSALALRCPAAVLHDRVLGQFHAVCETDHAAQLDTLLQDLDATATLPPLPQWQPPAQMEEDAPTRFTDGGQFGLGAEVAVTAGAVRAAARGQPGALRRPVHRAGQGRGELLAGAPGLGAWR